MSTNMLDYLYVDHTNIEPEWMKSERYEYCEDFPSLYCEKKAHKIHHSIPKFMTFFASLF